MEIKQLKLSDGEEIIAEILDEIEDELLVRLPLRIIKVDLSIDRTLFTFKSYMTYAEFTDQIVSINLYHIIAIAIPHEDLLEQYYRAREKIKEYKLDSKDLSVYDTTDSALKDAFSTIKTKIKDLNKVPGEEMDSASSNVIYVPFSTDKDKMH